MNPLQARLLAVTDRHQARLPLPDQVSALLEAGLRWIWLRDRDLPPGERRRLAEDVMARASQAGALLTIGANAALAAEIGAAGAHLRAVAELAPARRRLGAKALLGLSAHSLADVRDAASAGADYVTLSPIFASASKPGYGPALGLGALTQACAFGIPVLALGGIDPGNAAACIDSGAAGLAVMGPLMRTAAPGEILGLFRGAIARTGKTHQAGDVPAIA